MSESIEKKMMTEERAMPAFAAPERRLFVPAGFGDDVDVLVGSSGSTNGGGPVSCTISGPAVVCVSVAIAVRVAGRSEACQFI